MVQPKKRSLGAGERDEFLRAAWRVLFAGRVEAWRLVFVDEMGVNTALSAIYAWSRRGHRAHAKVGLTPEDGHTRVSDMKADEGGPRSAGINTTLYTRVQS